MTITIGGTEFGNLKVQPFGFEENDTKAGLSATKYIFNGLLLPSEWLNLVDIYQYWRSTRINDPPTEVSKAVGTTIGVSFTYNGDSTSSSCWFVSAPSGDVAGRYINATCELVVASEAVAVSIREKEIQDEIAKAEEDELGLPDFGYYSAGGASIKLSRPYESAQVLTTLDFTAGGQVFVSGPIGAEYLIDDVEGTTDAAGAASLCTWYRTQASSGSFNQVPLSPPSISCQNKLVDGVVITECNVSFQVVTLVPAS